MSQSSSVQSVIVQRIAEAAQRSVAEAVGAKIRVAVERVGHAVGSGRGERTDAESEIGIDGGVLQREFCGQKDRSASVREVEAR